MRAEKLRDEPQEYRNARIKDMTYDQYIKERDWHVLYNRENKKTSCETLNSNV
jgi:hypothetical protein